MDPTEVSMERSAQIKWGLAGWLGLNLAVAAFASLFKPGEWYEALAKPAWTPPNLAFPLVWTVLYTAMAVAAWRVWRTGGFSAARLPLFLYLAQLGFNGAWSWLFFGLNWTRWALAEILVLWILVGAT